jgi:hypothetical protein
MKHVYGLVALAAAAGFAFSIVALNAGCQSSDTGTDGYGGSISGTGGSGAVGTGGSGATGTGGSGATGTGGGGGTDAGSCAVGQTATIKDISDGTVGLNIQVHVTGAIVTAPKWLASSSKTTGSCLWGVFVKDPSNPVGMMLVSYGSHMTTAGDAGGECVSGSTEGIPDGLQAGDIIDFTGKVDAYAPSTCAADGGTAPTKQTQISYVCNLTKTGSGAAPDPVVVQPSDLLTGSNKNMQGLLVKVENVTTQNYDGGTVGPYGVIVLNEGPNLEIHDKLYFKQSGGPAFAPGQAFTSIVGVSHLDYCTWSLEPRNKCTDFAPPSTDCP